MKSLTCTDCDGTGVCIDALGDHSACAYCEGRGLLRRLQQGPVQDGDWIDLEFLWRQIVPENDVGRTMLLIGSLIGSILAIRCMIEMFLRQPL